MTIPPALRCPICGKAASPSARPFCSPRCAQVDLGRWLTESYRVPGAEIDETMLDEPELHSGAGKGSHEAG